MKLERLIFIAGILIFLYPTISDWWNSYHQSQVISRYNEKVENLNQMEYESIMQEAEEYNEKLGKEGLSWNLTEKEKKEYDSVLDMYDDGMFGYIEIPVIDCRLPVYHGTDEAVLQVGAGHMEGSSLPIGGTGSHCVISGHRGLTSARLFTGLDRLAIGDVFSFHILNEKIYYEVDRIETVLPEETQILTIEEGKDLCTLVTCTPYGINTHRLLVTGSRIQDYDESFTKRADYGKEGGMQMRGEDIAKWLVVCLLAGLFFITPKTEVHAQTEDGSLYKIEIQYEFPGTQFKLYRAEENDADLNQKELIGSNVTDERGITVFFNVTAGKYIITGEARSSDFSIYTPVASVITIPFSVADDSKTIVVKPKYEKETVEAPVLPQKPEQNIEDELPQTGQLWWPISILSLAGLVFFAIGWRKKRSDV